MAHLEVDAEGGKNFDHDVIALGCREMQRRLPCSHTYMGFVPEALNT